MKENELQLGALMTALILGSCLFMLPGCGAARSQNNALFKQGRDLVRTGRYEEAIAPLTQFQREQPHAELASNAGLYLGKAYLALGRFDEARTAWGDTVENYPNSLEGHKCRYKLAFLSFMEGDTQSALDQFTALADAPDGPLAPEALAFRTFLEKQGNAERLPQTGE